jgi:hypothetical protein
MLLMEIILGTSFISIFVDDQIVEYSERRDTFNNALESRSISSIACI